MIINGHLKTASFKSLRAHTPGAPHLADPHSWVLAADERQAWVLAKAGRKLETLGHIRARDPAEIDLEGASDGAHIDRSHDQSRYQPALTETRQTELRFAKKLAAWLDHAVQEKAFDSLILVAAPRMLGELRAELSKNVLARVAEEVNKDVASYSEERLIQELPRLIPGPDREQKQA